MDLPPVPPEPGQDAPPARGGPAFHGVPEPLQRAEGYLAEPERLGEREDPPPAGSDRPPADRAYRSARRRGYQSHPRPAPPVLPEGEELRREDPHPARPVLPLRPHHRTLAHGAAGQDRLPARPAERGGGRPLGRAGAARPPPADRDFPGDLGPARRGPAGRPAHRGEPGGHRPPAPRDGRRGEPRRPQRERPDPALPRDQARAGTLLLLPRDAARHPGDQPGVQGPYPEALPAGGAADRGRVPARLRAGAGGLARLAARPRAGGVSRGDRAFREAAPEGGVPAGGHRPDPPEGARAAAAPHRGTPSHGRAAERLTDGDVDRRGGPQPGHQRRRRPPLRLRGAARRLLSPAGRRPEGGQPPGPGSGAGGASPRDFRP